MIEAYRRLAAPRVVGLMSGTSADGIDAALVEVGPEVRLLAFRTVPYPEETRRRLFELFEDRGGPREVARLNALLGELFARAARAVMGGKGADLVASHGQTVAHLPDEGATLQLGEGAVIAARTGCLTVSDFRPADLAQGGQGAPLVPFADARLLHTPSIDRAALNLGGMANLTWIPARGEVQACDTGPGNALLDALAEALLGAPWDEGGRRAAEGRVVPELLEELLAHPYFAREGPKSTGRETFGRPMARRLLGRAAPGDLLRTAAALTAESVVRHLKRHLRGPAELVVGGGGVENATLMEELRRRLPAEVRLRLYDDFGIPFQAREAVAFALLGHETVHGRPASLPGATGARRPAVLGKVSFP